MCPGEGKRGPGGPTPTRCTARPRCGSLIQQSSQVHSPGQAATRSRVLACPGGSTESVAVAGAWLGRAAWGTGALVCQSPCPRQPQCSRSCETGVPGVIMVKGAWGLRRGAQQDAGSLDPLGGAPHYRGRQAQGRGSLGLPATPLQADSSGHFVPAPHVPTGWGLTSRLLLPGRTSLSPFIVPTADGHPSHSGPCP